MTYADRIPAPRPIPGMSARFADARQSSLSLTQEIAHRLRTHQWYDNPKFENLREPSAHATHEGTGFTTDCAICLKNVDAIAAVAASVISDRTDAQRPTPHLDAVKAERDEALEARDNARAERDVYQTQVANLRAQLDRTNAARQYTADQLDQAVRERDQARAELATKTEVAQGNKRHVAYLTAVIEAIANVEPHIHNGNATEDNCSPYCPGCRIRTAMNTTIDAPTAGLGSAPPRAQEKPATAATGLPTGTDETLAWMRRHGLGHGAGVGAVLAAVRADLARP